MGASPAWAQLYDPPGSEWSYWWSSKVDQANPVLGSGQFLPSLTTTTGFTYIPFTSVSSGSGGIPTGVPAGASTQGPALVWNDVTHTLNIYSPTAAAWFHVTLSTNAG